MIRIIRRLKRDLLGFSGLAGLRWYTSVMRESVPLQREDLSLQQEAGPYTRFLEIDGKPIAYREQGQGEPAILLLHGFGGRLETWDAVQPLLAEKHRTIAFDLWGFGVSARPFRLTQRDWVRQVFGVMDALGIPSAVLAAHSLGGRVSLMCAAEQPARVRGLVLCDADWGHVPHGYVLAWLIAQTRAFPNSLARLRSNPSGIESLLHLAYGRNFPVSPVLVNQYHRPLRIHGNSACLTRLGRREALNWPHGIFRHISSPALVLWGEDDLIIPADYARPLARHLAAEAILLPDCGHFPQEEHPQATVSYINAFLARLPA